MLSVHFGYLLSSWITCCRYISVICCLPGSLFLLLLFLLLFLLLLVFFLPTVHRPELLIASKIGEWKPKLKIFGLDVAGNLAHHVQQEGHSGWSQFVEPVGDVIWHRNAW